MPDPVRGTFANSGVNDDPSLVADKFQTVALEAGYKANLQIITGSGHFICNHPVLVMVDLGSLSKFRSFSLKKTAHEVSGVRLLKALNASRPSLYELALATKPVTLLSPSKLGIYPTRHFFQHLST